MRDIAIQNLRRIQVDHHADLDVPDPPRIEKVARILLKRVPYPAHLLDLGYSRGSFSDYLAKAGWNCTGVDLAGHANNPIPVIQCDLNDGLPDGLGTYDVITAGEVIEHMIDERYFLQECRRCLKPSGLLVLTTPNLCFSVNRLRVLFGSTPLFVYAPYHLHFHTKTTLTALLESEGFAIQSVLSSHVLYSRRRHWTGRVFELLGDLLPTWGAHLIVFATKDDKR